MNGLSEVVKRALGYPYAVPSRSFALVDGRAADLGAVKVDLSSRTALLAYGSNASPEVLARKLAGDPDPVPVLRATLHDFDAVYSAHVSAYGSVPATLQRSPGTEVAVFVAYPTPSQLDLIEVTEPNYELVALDETACTLESGESPSGLRSYLSRHGCLLLGDTEVALAAVPASGRRFQAMDQRLVLERVRDILRPGHTLSEFVSLSLSGPWSLPATGLRSSSSTRGRSSSL